MEAIFPQHELCCILRAIPLYHISLFPLKSSILKTSFYVLLGEVHYKRQRNPYSVGDQHVIDSRQKNVLSPLFLITVLSCSALSTLDTSGGSSPTWGRRLGPVVAACSPDVVVCPLAQWQHG